MVVCGSDDHLEMGAPSYLHYEFLKEVRRASQVQTENFKRILLTKYLIKQAEKEG